MNKAKIYVNLQIAQDLVHDAIKEGLISDTVTGSFSAKMMSALGEAISGFNEQPPLVVPGNEAAAIKYLADALQPFAAILTPERYEDSDPIAVEITVSREIAQKYAQAWDDMKAQGREPNFPRPNLENGFNFPTEVLNPQGISIGDVRQAQRILELLSAPPIPAKEEQH